MILIGGRSRSGKSTFAKVLEKVLYSLTENPIIISTESWLSLEKRSLINKNLAEVYNLNLFKNFFHDILIKDKPIYAKTKFKLPNSENQFYRSFKIFNNTTVIIEGCATSYLDNDILDQSFLIWVEDNEIERKHRCVQNYKFQKDENKSIYKQLNDMTNKENDKIDQARKFANLIWSKS